MMVLLIFFGALVRSYLTIKIRLILPALETRPRFPLDYLQRSAYGRLATATIQRHYTKKKRTAAARRHQQALRVILFVSRAGRGRSVYTDWKVVNSFVALSVHIFKSYTTVQRYND